MAPATTSPTTRLPWALAYAARGWPIFPCHTPTAEGCSCRRKCGRVGKHPRTQHGLLDATTDPATITRWWKQWPQANIAVATGSTAGLVVLDEDTYKGGDISRIALEQTHGLLPDTVEQLTGGGGLQFFFAHPGPSVKNGVETLGPGLDIRGDGGYVILPPSLHASGKEYVWELSHDWEEIPLAPMPSWLLALCHDRPQSGALDVGALIPQGQRNRRLFEIGCSLRARGLSHAALLAALGAVNATQCQPPLDESEVIIVAKSCAGYPAGTSTPLPISSNGTHPPPVDPVLGVLDWHIKLLTTKGGDAKENIPNIMHILAHHPDWHGKLWWDTVRSVAMVDGRPISDQLLAQVGTWFGTTEHMPVRSFDLLQKCLISAAQDHPRDLLQEELDALPAWDGIPRLDDWLADVSGVEKSIYAMDVSRLLILSMVARARDPGCLYRYVVIFEGPEETGKSTLVRELAGEGWYVELSLGLESKEAHMMLQGAWVAELSELDAMGRTEDTRMKAFITMKEDSYIPKFSNNRLRVKRRTVFIGTTNEFSYLKGQTGNTRYLPIKFGHAVDIPLFLSLRPQLFAEAAFSYTHHETDWWQLRAESIEEARLQRDARRVVNEYEVPLQDWLARRPFPQDITTWPEIARDFLEMPTPERWKDKALQMQIASALRSLGWTSKLQRDGGKVQRHWAPP